MGFSRQEYWSELPFPSPGDLLNPGIEPVPLVSVALQADSLPAGPLGKPRKYTRCSTNICSKLALRRQTKDDKYEPDNEATKDRK